MIQCVTICFPSHHQMFHLVNYTTLPVSPLVLGDV